MRQGRGILRCFLQRTDSQRCRATVFWASTLFFFLWLKDVNRLPLEPLSCGLFSIAVIVLACGFYVSLSCLQLKHFLTASSSRQGPGQATAWSPAGPRAMERWNPLREACANPFLRDHEVTRASRYLPSVRLPHSCPDRMSRGGWCQWVPTCSCLTLCLPSHSQAL